MGHTVHKCLYTQLSPSDQGCIIIGKCGSDFNIFYEYRKIYDIS